MTNSTTERSPEPAPAESVARGPGEPPDAEVRGSGAGPGAEGGGAGDARRTEPESSPSFWTVFADLASLTKPGITRLVVFTTAAGYVLATGADADIVRLFHTVFGAALASAGANALNMWWERESDAAMNRTRKRPLPAGRVAPRVALVFALLISAWGLLHLALFVNVPTLAIVATSLFSYILVYTPLKRRTHHATLIGALPGSLPTLAGWTAANEPIGATALAITGVVFFWQMPHFYALVWVYREDYARGGHKMLTAVDPEGTRLGLESFVYSMLLLAVSVVPIYTGMMDWVYGVGAVVLGVAMVLLSIRLWRVRDNQRAWHLFFGSIAYLPVLLTLMLMDRLVV